MACALALLAGCTSAAEPRASGGRCGGLTVDDVRGPRPSYVEGRIADFPNDRALCRGSWLPGADQDFVPQGLALDGRTAWVTGYRHEDRYGNRPCQVAHVALTGKVLAFLPRLDGSVGGRDPVMCRHGGGAALTRAGLWVVETDRLWLLDPDRVGHGDPVLRVWRIEDPVKGSVLVQGSGGRLGLAGFHDARPGRVFWYDVPRLLAPGRTALVASPRSRVAGFAPAELVPPARVGRAPVRAQGGAVLGGRRPTYTSSTSTCGLLLLPDGRRVGFAPGVEDVERGRGGLLWAVLESGARPYQRRDRPLVPMLAGFDADAVLHGKAATCGW